MTIPTLSDALQVTHKYAPHFRPKVGLILGSGLSPIAEQLTDAISIPYQAIPGLHAGTVSGHPSMLVLGYLNKVPVACMKGRLHLYETGNYDGMRMLVRLLKGMGCSSVVITGAAGSLRPEVGPGEIVAITDHINLHPGNPLVGLNDESIGPRFVSLEEAYDPGLLALFKESAEHLRIDTHEGIYLSVLGPIFETPAEIRMFRQWGADTVGMSIVPEVMLARHCGLKVLGINAITNLAVGLSAEKVTHEVTLRYAEVAARKLINIIPEFIERLNRED